MPGADRPRLPRYECAATACHGRHLSATMACPPVRLEIPLPSQTPGWKPGTTAGEILHWFEAVPRPKPGRMQASRCGHAWHDGSRQLPADTRRCGTCMRLLAGTGKPDADAG